MRAGDITLENRTPFYRYRGKGGKTGRRELPLPAYTAICEALSAFGKTMATMKAEDPLWPSVSRSTGITSGTFYGRLRRYLREAGLPLFGVHVFRH